MIQLDLQPQQGKALMSDATEIFYGGAAGGGKLLPLDTPIPTPRGWETMGNLAVGSTILAETGEPCRVSRLFDIDPNPELYRITFDDGATIDACRDHQWLTLTAAELAAQTRRDPDWRAARRAKRPSRAKGNKSKAFTEAIQARNAAAQPAAKPAPTGSIRTTAEILATLKTAKGRANHAIPTTAPLNLGWRHLPIEPYTFGLWLGDGTRGQGAITQCSADMEAVEDHILADGFTIRKRKAVYAWGILGLQKRLRESQLLTARQIPAEFLRASQKQRLALLQGIMDADGHAKENGGCEFTSVYRQLAEDVAELLHTLGIKAAVREGRAKIKGRDCGPKYRINFTAPFPCFRLPRKAERQNLDTRRTTRYRYITAVQPIASRPGRCIEVDSPSHLYLAGRDFIPTHNSHLMRVAAIAWAMQIPGLQIAIFRRLYPDLHANHMEGPTSFPVLLAALVQAKVCRIVKDSIIFANRSKITLRHCQYEQDKYRYQGAEFHVLMIDELTHFTDTMYRYLRGRVRMTGVEVPEEMKGRFPRILCSGNPGGIGHLWVKKTFVEQGPYRIVQTEPEEGGLKRQFIPAKLSDNPALLNSDPFYSNRLSGLGDPILVRAMLDGDWKIAAGSMFGEAWRDELHVMDSFAIPPDWPIWRGGDDGFAAPASIHWLTEDPRDKIIYVIAEIYRSGLLPNMLASQIKSVDKSIPLWDWAEERPFQNPNASYDGLLDCAAFSDNGQGDIARGKQLNRMGCRFKPAEKWPGSRIHRVQNLHRLLAVNPKTGLPGIRFFKCCRAAIETIPVLPRDKNNAEDVDTDAEDHAFDSLTYGLQRKSRSGGKAKVAGT
jgi:hypothetical protein